MPTIKNEVIPASAAVTANAALEVDSGEVVAAALTVDAGAFGASGAQDLVYSATAEDNGTAGEMDGQPGFVASGVADGIRLPIRVKITNLDLVEGTIAPEATDRVTAVIAVNSEVVANSAAGFAALTGEAATEHDMDTTVYVARNDVVRIAVQAAADSEDALDVSVPAAEVTLS